MASTFFNFFCNRSPRLLTAFFTREFWDHPLLSLRARTAGRLLAYPLAITSAMTHSVSDHLHVMIADYDRFIRTVIPHYEMMRAVQLDLLTRCLPPEGRVLDLGGGTGSLARARSPFRFG